MSVSPIVPDDERPENQCDRIEAVAWQLNILTTTSQTRILPLIEGLLFAARMNDASYAAIQRRLIGE